MKHNQRRDPTTAGESATQWYIRVAFKNGDFALRWRLPRAGREESVDVIFEGTAKVTLAHTLVVVARLITIASAVILLLRALEMIP